MRFFYAVLKDGTIVNNVKSLLTIDKQDKLQSSLVKLLTADVDILKDIESYYCCPLKVSEQLDIHPQCCCNGIADDFSEGKPLS
nr:MAG TPA: hypothetical protein [Caudoviricetes sp.]